MLTRLGLAGLFSWRPLLATARAAYLKAHAAANAPRVRPIPDQEELHRRADELGGDLHAGESELVSLLLEMLRLALRDAGSRVRLSQLFEESPVVSALVEQFRQQREDVEVMAKMVARLMQKCGVKL